MNEAYKRSSGGSVIARSSITIDNGSTTNGINNRKSSKGPGRIRVKRLVRKRNDRGRTLLRRFFMWMILILMGYMMFQFFFFSNKDDTTNSSNTVARHGIDTIRKALRRNKKRIRPPKTDDDANLSNDDNDDRDDTSLLYKHSDFLPHIGDKSASYANLRQHIDQILPHNDIPRMQSFVQNLHQRQYQSIMSHDMSYDIFNCPTYPPPHYPQAWNIQSILSNWAPDDATPPHPTSPQIYQGLCVFDYPTEKEKAIHYREAEVPFIVRNDPKVLRTTERWNYPNYMNQLLGNIKHRTEYSPNNHFMYWTKPRNKDKARGIIPDNWKPPTEMMRIPYEEWLKHANVTDDSQLGPDKEHWYYRLIGCGEMGLNCDMDSSEYLFDELAFFQPTEENDLYMVKPKEQKGIHCRFGMKGVIAENHFDGSRNMIALMKGERRYILAHPDQCDNLHLLPRGHPSARHSAVDWSDPDWESFPKFKDAQVNEVVLQAGDVLYLPTNWFHYIISLELNFQCNTRSGISNEYMAPIHACGF